ncbi:DUF2182 domain-containing protein [Dyella caseinilytica]|uniref:DUF2182 domain-containing protein n=1 Tax=Dyella caseinilytica TaxID=1849581 RepID=A0ABX7GPU4_9GAMM|nr:DUF2182 domain-containing protein [Dyella caseinilytica]QRN51939.1 DUF2182 domain-containing protein [Dyella caseinilytica]GGA03790.1 hypothetical protein GCM10011408_26680 [Dyella caseinilytica]
MSQHMLSLRASRHAFVGIVALLFIGSAAMTIIWGAPMSTMDDMPMPGDWTMSMAWMRMPGQTWFGAALSFLSMWITMMMAMMLPSLVPMLWRYREAVVRAGEAPLARLTVSVGAGYFFVWTLLGIAVFPAAVVLTAIAMTYPSLARAVPFLTGVAIVMIGALQFTAWKARHLASCRADLGCCRTFAADAGTAWLYGLRLGVHCVYCCAGLTALLLIMGLMDLRAMALVTATITLERLAPRGERTAQVMGVAIVGAGVFLTAEAAIVGLG